MPKFQPFVSKKKMVPGVDGVLLGEEKGDRRRPKQLQPRQPGT